MNKIKISNKKFIKAVKYIYKYCNKEDCTNCPAHLDDDKFSWCILEEPRYPETWEIKRLRNIKIEEK